MRDLGLAHMAASYGHIFTAAYFTASDDDGCTCYPVSNFEIPETAWRIPAPRPWMYAAWKIQSGRIFALDFRGEQPFSFEQECSNRRIDRGAAKVYVSRLKTVYNLIECCTEDGYSRETILEALRLQGITERELAVALAMGLRGSCTVSSDTRAWAASVDVTDAKRLIHAVGDHVRCCILHMELEKFIPFLREKEV